ncbi:hypothetical protein FZI86_23165 [Mycobacterium sp. CBMA335]|uniref:Uncharacterized protein n=2 Tax=Mycolicibacterium TaxID=1866885 RepID=A0A343VRF7_9MYCO|nr:hypothetical protein [Mycolicibacterium sp. CBMA 213]AVN58481.1 hypothetical protein B5P44_p00186 [Mycolicibacterium sp. CBMA 213]MUL61133.1 hypothetical protein [Mycolicibacterium sp. CBMA 335]
MAVGQYFHGGKPGLAPGDFIRSAAELGFQFEYGSKKWLSGAKAEYDPRFVYVTPERGTAMGYAARYVDESGLPRPGWVYLVQPDETPVLDPDYGPLAAGLAERCSRATVVEVVARDVCLSEREQNRLAWPHLHWAPGLPQFAEDGTLIPSPQMVESGVVQAYIDLLPKWIGLTEVNGHGQMTVDGGTASPSEVLSRFDHVRLVDHGHIVSIINRRVVPNVLRCSCGDEFGESPILSPPGFRVGFVGARFS